MRFVILVIEWGETMTEIELSVRVYAGTVYIEAFRHPCDRMG